MKQFISKIPNDVQDKNSDAWIRLCEYIDELVESEEDEFFPLKALGGDLYSQIFTLPESIGKLKKVKKIALYGSSLKRIPPQIGEMESLEYFDPYTSYHLHWLPYEITKCTKLKDSRVSTRSLYGNYKYRNPFPSLHKNQVRYENDVYICGVCGKLMNHKETEQYWITLYVGTDFMPLLVNICSDDCLDLLPVPEEGYVQYPHKGGSKLEQPKLDEYEYYKMRSSLRENKTGKVNNEPSSSKLFSVIKKLWE